MEREQREKSASVSKLKNVISFWMTNNIDELVIGIGVYAQQLIWLNGCLSLWFVTKNLPVNENFEAPNEH